MPVIDGMVRAAKRGLGLDEREERLGANGRQSRAAAEQAAQVGLTAVGRHSTPEEIADWEKRLWHDQDDLLEIRAKDWKQTLHYCANEPYIAYHRDQRRWIPLKSVPWRIRSKYNITQKAVNIRVARLVENKPSVTVQARTSEQGDLDKAERKEAVWWYLWHQLHLHTQIILARRWSTKAGSGLLKGGWDPDAGTRCPATRMVPRYEEQMVPATDEAGQPVLDITGAPIMVPQQVYIGLEEAYLGKGDVELGPVSRLEPDPDRPGEYQRVANPVPEEAVYYAPGEAYIDVRSPFNVRWDRYVDDIAESWYIQDAEILPATKILGLELATVEQLQHATSASESDKAIQWQGLVPLQGNTDLGSFAGIAQASDADRGKSSEREVLDREYLVRQTYIFPKTSYLRKLWGEDGALLITIGEVCVAKRALPKWARRRCPYVQFIDTPEEGNHYHKSIIRDVIPLQDDINRARSHWAESVALRSRFLLGAPQGHSINVKVLGALPGALVTYRSSSHKPEPIDLGRGADGAEQFYEASLSAAADVAMMNDASVGKLPSAGIAAKALYALQYAEERGIVEVSAHQDEALKRLAELLDAITREMYSEARKIRIMGEDQSFLLDDEAEVSPKDLEVDVDYVFTPGSMLSRQKESVKNELLQLLQLQLVDVATVRKYLPTAVPDAFKVSHDLQYQKARRQLRDLVRRVVPQVALEPWQDPAVVAGVLEEFLLSAKAERLGQPQRLAVMQLWQAAKVTLQQMQMQAAAANAASQAGRPNQATGGPGGGQPIGSPDAFSTPGGVAELEGRAKESQSPPAGYGEPPPMQAG